MSWPSVSPKRAKAVSVNPMRKSTIHHLMGIANLLFLNDLDDLREWVPDPRMGGVLSAIEGSVQNIPSGGDDRIRVGAKRGRFF